MEFQELTLDNWKEFAELLGPRGACGGCWCMFWRMKRAEYEKSKGDRNKKLLKKLVSKNQPLGIIAMEREVAMGWCSVSPREDFIRLENSKVARPVDDKPVWSIVCLYIRKEFRNAGLSVNLLKAAAKYVKDNGGKIVEGYPIDPTSKKFPDTFAFTGLASAFLKAGFKEVARNSETRPTMRKILK